MSSIRPLIAGNWKMHGLASALGEARVLAQALAERPPASRVAICPPATLISRFAAVVGDGTIEVGGQDCRAEEAGAFTGDIAPEMLADAGARLVILGHSERRAYHQEGDALIARKAIGGLRAGLEPIVCVGESWEQRQAGEALATVRRQLDGSLPSALEGHAFAVAYEPVWAIGSGVTPALEQIDEMHGSIRADLVFRFGGQGLAVPILYGGSVKPDNAGELLAREEVNGALVGGASLLAGDFLRIVMAA